jgi:hypothetical protein
MNRREDRLESLREQRRALERFLLAGAYLNPETLSDFKDRLKTVEEEIKSTENF